MATSLLALLDDIAYALDDVALLTKVATKVWAVAKGPVVMAAAFDCQK